MKPNAIVLNLYANLDLFSTFKCYLTLTCLKERRWRVRVKKWKSYVTLSFSSYHHQKILPFQMGKSLIYELRIICAMTIQKCVVHKEKMSLYLAMSQRKASINYRVSPLLYTYANFIFIFYIIFCTESRILHVHIPAADDYCESILWVQNNNLIKIKYKSINK